MHDPAGDPTYAATAVRRPHADPGASPPPQNPEVNAGEVVHFVADKKHARHFGRRSMPSDRHLSNGNRVRLRSARAYDFWAPRTSDGQAASSVPGLLLNFPVFTVRTRAKISRTASIASALATLALASSRPSSSLTMRPVL